MKTILSSTNLKKLETLTGKHWAQIRANVQEIQREFAPWTREELYLLQEEQRDCLFALFFFGFIDFNEFHDAAIAQSKAKTLEVINKFNAARRAEGRLTKDLLHFDSTRGVCINLAALELRQRQKGSPKESRQISDVNGSEWDSVKFEVLDEK